jgi:hypothetical protein
MENQTDIQSHREEHVERAIEAITLQIELLSNRCQMVGNKKSEQIKMDTIIEASTLLLQLSRSLNELIITQNALENVSMNKKTQSAQNDVHNIIFKGRT